MPPTPETPADLPNPAASALRKAAGRLLPFLALLYIFNILDRSNVGFARLTMQRDLGLSQAAFDLGYGIFYFGYLAFEVPANLLLRRVGARRWIARIMVSWGLVSCATMFVTDVWSFYAVRILLGVAEAGFFPGIIFYLTNWFPDRERARVIALFMTAIAFSGVVGNPLSGAIMQYLHGEWGLAGWQWLFLLEGLPSVLLGLVVLVYLPDGPAQARWLSAAEREALMRRLEQDERRAGPSHAGLAQAARSGVVWLLIAVYFTAAVGSNAAGAYYPQLISGRFPGADKFVIGLLSALPHVCAIVGMTLLSASSDRTGERRGHVALAAALAASGWLLAWQAPSPWLALAGLCLAQAGVMSMLPTFWALATAQVRGTAAAGGIALINSVANIGGLVGPAILGRFGPASMAAALLTGGVLALAARFRPPPREGPALPEVGPRWSERPEERSPSSAVRPSIGEVTGTAPPPPGPEP
jgi:ACS family tartrate transporter-like MFS transporter